MIMFVVARESEVQTELLKFLRLVLASTFDSRSLGSDAEQAGSFSYVCQVLVSILVVTTVDSVLVVFMNYEM